MHGASFSVKFFFKGIRSALFHHLIEPFLSPVLAFLLSPVASHDHSASVLLDVFFNKPDVVSLVKELVLAYLDKTLRTSVVSPESTC